MLHTMPLSLTTDRQWPPNNFTKIALLGVQNYTIAPLPKSVLHEQLSTRAYLVHTCLGFANSSSQFRCHENRLKPCRVSILMDKQTRRTDRQ